MKKIGLIFLTILFVIGPMMVEGTQAGWHGYYGGWGHGYHRGWGPGIYWGGPVVLGPPWYPYNYYPQQPTVVQQTPLYVQPQQQDAYYWYYCENPKGYYPYVSSCPSGWTKVLPTPQTVPPN
jgi:hypothetical protein